MCSKAGYLELTFLDKMQSAVVFILRDLLPARCQLQSQGNGLQNCRCSMGL